MKYLTAILLLLGIFCSPKNRPVISSNEKAKIVFEENLNFLSLCAKNNSIDTLYKAGNAISFFERLTLIESESDGTFFGKLYPTVTDIERWRSWYSQNKDNLIWDSTTATIQIRNR